MIKAKETLYNGYKFRSRTEARWAVYFDFMGIKFHYEHEDFILPIIHADGVRYLPDFYLPEFRVFAEVKGAEFNSEEIAKCKALCYKTGKDVFMLDGPPDFKEYEAFHWGRTESCDCNKIPLLCQNKNCRVNEWYSILEFSGHFAGREYGIFVAHEDADKNGYFLRKEDSAVTDEMVKAVYASRCARFENFKI